MIKATMMVTLSAACFLSFVWGAAAHFRREGPMPRRMLATTIANLCAFGWFLGICWFDRVCIASADLLASAMAALGIVGSAGLFWWAVAANRAQPLSIAFSIDEPRFVQQSGPYAHVRHPFYLSYIMFWLAAAVEVGTRLYWIVPIGMSILYYHVARLEEAKFAASSLSSGYDSYKARTGMLLPSVTRQCQRVR